jgi:hypothetical protein
LHREAFARVDDRYPRGVPALPLEYGQRSIVTKIEYRRLGISGLSERTTALDIGWH